MTGWNVGNLTFMAAHKNINKTTPEIIINVLANDFCLFTSLGFASLFGTSKYL